MILKINYNSSASTYSYIFGVFIENKGDSFKEAIIPEISEIETSGINSTFASYSFSFLIKLWYRFFIA
jgi:hypothetical protein